MGAVKIHLREKTVFDKVAQAWKPVKIITYYFCKICIKDWAPFLLKGTYKFCEIIFYNPKN